MTELYFYVPGQRNVVDAVRYIDGVAKGLYGGKTLQDVQAEHPTAVLADLDTVRGAIDALCITPFSEITQEQFIDALEVLPPLDWQRYPNHESFKFVEFYCGNITSIYVRRGQQCYACKDDAGLTHEAIMAKLAEQFPL